MNKKLVKTASAVMLAFTLAACGELPEDIAQKPAVADDLVQASLEQCTTGPVHGSDVEYAARLRTVLMATPTKDLKTLKDNGTTICLDQRLAAQTLGKLDKAIDGIFYNGKQKSTVGLWDNGKAPKESRFYERNAYDDGRKMLAILAEKLREGEISAEDRLMYAARYIDYCSKNCWYTVIKWKAAPSFNKDSISKNPDLEVPPLRVSAPRQLS